MFLKKLQFENLRNFEAFSCDFTTNINIFLGPNGAGKTSILEAIALMAIPKSFRTSRLPDLIKFEEDYFRVCGEFAGGTQVEMGYRVVPAVRRALKYQKASVSLATYMKCAYAVTFVPQDLNMLDLGPSLRREWMDRLLCKLNFMYMRALSRYEKVLRERNRALKDISEGKCSVSALHPWDSQLIEHGTLIVRERLALTKYMRTHLPPMYTRIAGGSDIINISYHTQKEAGETQKKNPSTDLTESEIAENLNRALGEKQSRDISAKSTSVGPHRDDLHFTMNEKSMEHFASRGEKRTLLISLKVCELELMHERSGKKPLLLLDDVFSELDLERQTHMLKLIGLYQTFITTNSKEHFSLFEGDKTVWEIENGKLKVS